MKRVRILGTRGIPARHGGFETFAEQLSRYLVERGWEVIVYCQDDEGHVLREDTWEGVRRIHVPTRRLGAWGTIEFDWHAIAHARRERGLVLTLGYNTAAFGLRYLGRSLPHLINMDGLEYARAKWSWPQRAWLFLNERAGCYLGHRLIADHPEIAAHLATRVSAAKIVTIPYGAKAIEQAEVSVLERWGLAPQGYALVVARPEPENSVLEIVRAFSRAPRNCRLVVLGKYDPDHPYHAAVRSAASSEVLFPGAIYEPEIVAALRFFARLYVHGHTVGGTNPSLVEALGAGSPVLAHDNRFNRWVAGPEAAYFGSEAEGATAFAALLEDAARLELMQAASRREHAARFTWERVLGSYEELLEAHCDA